MHLFHPGSSWFTVVTVVTVVRLQDVVICFKVLEGIEPQLLVPGMTLYTSKEHMCRAALESTAFQAVDIMEAR